MVARVWRGYATREHADAYAAMLKPELLPGLSKVKGYRGSYLLRRDHADEVVGSDCSGLTDPRMSDNIAGLFH